MSRGLNYFFSLSIASLGRGDIRKAMAHLYTCWDFHTCIYNLIVDVDEMFQGRKKKRTLISPL